MSHPRFAPGERPPNLCSGIMLPAIVLATLFLTSSLQAAADPFQTLTVTLQPKVSEGVIPAWETGKISIQPEADAIILPVPALASQDDVGCFAITVVFQDNGDGGPVVEWQTAEGESTLLSAGLGESGVPVGLNVRTLLLSQSLTLDGGTLKVSFAGRFARLVSVSLRPAREIGIAALGAEFTPALFEKNEPVLTGEEVSGADVTPASGDTTEGNVVHAELSIPPKRLDFPGANGLLEFVVPLTTTPQGSLLQTEVAGLDPESWIELTVNGESLGALGIAPFSLTSPGVLFSSSGRLLVAGWRPASLFIPSRLWKQGDNAVIFTLHRAVGDEGKAVTLQKSTVDFLFSPSGITATNASSATAAPAPSLTSTPNPVLAQNTPPPSTPSSSPSPDNILSTGSVYGNPSPALFHATLPASLPMENNSAQ